MAISQRFISYYANKYGPATVADPALLQIVKAQELKRWSDDYNAMLERAGLVKTRRSDPIDNPSTTTKWRQQQRAKKAVDPANIDNMFNTMQRRLG